MAVKQSNSRAEFVKLREAYEVLSDIYELGGTAEKTQKGIKLARIPREAWGDITGRLKGCESLVGQLIEGPGEKRSFSGESEVVLAGVEKDGDIHVCALLMTGRSRISSSLSFFLSDDDWKKRLAGFVDWGSVGSVIAAADGNNQRFVIGLVLSLAGIGKGRLAMTEVEIPQEIDESTHLVRGAEWMKAGLPRFRSAASEALWYAMRLRSVHSRVVRTKKQGFYTSLAMTSLFAAGADLDTISKQSGMPQDLVRKLIFTSPDNHVSEKDMEFMRDFIFEGSELPEETARVNAAMRIWKGPAIFKRGMDWRITVSRKAREALFEGKDLVEVAGSFRIQRRELVRILSVSLGEAVLERDRFLCGVVKPSTLKGLLG